MKSIEITTLVLRDKRGNIDGATLSVDTACGTWTAKVTPVERGWRVTDEHGSVETAKSYTKALATAQEWLLAEHKRGEELAGAAA